MSSRRQRSVNISAQLPGIKRGQGMARSERSGRWLASGKYWPKCAFGDWNARVARRL